MKYKSIDEVENMLNDDNSYKELSHRQEVRQRQKDRKNVDLDTEAELVYEDADWEVWVPKTYAASCKLGQGTTWCTASTETDSYYNSYKNEYGGEYFININKHDPEEKYQFHFESNQFMDKYDDEIDLLDFLNSNKGLYNFYKKITPKTTFIIENGILIQANVPMLEPEITIPDSVTRINKTAFFGCKNLTIKCNKGSYAEQYAKDNNIPYELINEIPESMTITEALRRLPRR